MSVALLLAFGIGIVAGLRSLLAPAVVAWAAHFDLLNLNGSPLAFMGSRTAAVIFSIFALGELIGDKLPSTPKRTALVPLLARIVLGALSGASLCVAAGNSLLGGALLGGMGGTIGAFAGYEIRRRIARSFHIKDIFIAVCEDIVAIALACFIVSR
ncbi:MAG TPA: DUF4126 family protein [Candidatus Udaeobacter sp.]|nr:DUF4126 family protein [Candidatus Udaeobacter sp.]